MAGDVHPPVPPDAGQLPNRDGATRLQVSLEGEATTIRSFRIVRREGTRDVTRSIAHYSLDAILGVGYRVRSARGTAFRQWATARLGELLVKGLILDDERLKEAGTLALTAALRDQQTEAAKLDTVIRGNLKELGFGG